MEERRTTIHRYRAALGLACLFLVPALIWKKLCRANGKQTLSTTQPWAHSCSLRLEWKWCDIVGCVQSLLTLSAEKKERALLSGKEDGGKRVRDKEQAALIQDIADELQISANPRQPVNYLHCVINEDS
jgi:hypothetical protein